jgi:hypothetical protein
MKHNLAVFILCFVIGLFALNRVSLAQTQNNASGSNTAITGGYTSNSTSTFQSGSSSNTTSTTSNTTNAYSGDTRVTSPATAPSMSAYSQDLCLVGYSAGVSTFGVGVTGGSYSSDLNCERIKLSKVLNDLGMKVAAVSILCQDPRVFFAMEQSGTPCPFEGKIGAEANAAWLKYDKLRPDYNQYVDKLVVIENARKEEELKKLNGGTTEKK